MPTDKKISDVISQYEAPSPIIPHSSAASADLPVPSGNHHSNNNSGSQIELSTISKSIHAETNNDVDNNSNNSNNNNFSTNNNRLRKNHHFKKSLLKRKVHQKITSLSTTTTASATTAAAAAVDEGNQGHKNNKNQHATATKVEGEEKLGTYNGVFLPCLAQIVGVIFFLRLPSITGQAGTFYATLIILVCVLSTFVTSLSLSAIASNGTIQAGGPYYIISRTLGVEIGGSLGILFYLGTTLGASMHVMGAVETMTQSNHGQPYQLDNFGIFLSIVETVPSQVWSLLLMFIISQIVSVGSKYVTGAANFFLAVVGLSIVSIMVGTILFALGLYDGNLSEDERVFNDNLHPSYRPDSKTGLTPTFWGLVALFYPATTGILAGTNRSSKLATPNKSIPTGTIGAIFVTTLLYVLLVWLLGSVVSNEVLVFNKLVVAAIAFPSPVIARLGVVTACVGAALQCMAGGPQLLAAMAADDAIPFLKFLTRKKRRRNDLIKAVNAKGIEVVGLEGLDLTSHSLDKSLPLNVDFESEASEQVEAENSKRAVWFSWAIASLGTLLGNIDHITPILTMFYLIMYGGINVCCFLLAWVDSPGFRPQFKYFSRNIALIGFFWCIGLAFVISWQMATLALGLVYVIFKYIRYYDSQMNRKSSPGADWGEVIDSVKYKLTTAVLARVTGSENFHAKNWIPQVLTLVDTDKDGHPISSEVLALAAQLQKGRGLNVVISIKDGSFLGDGTFEQSQQCKKTLKAFMEKERLMGYAKVIFSRGNYPETVWSSVLNSGLGPVSPNIVLMSWVADWRKLMKRGEEEEGSISDCSETTDLYKPYSVEDYADSLKGLINMRRAVCIFKGLFFPTLRDQMPRGSTIDIYWVVDDGGICLLMSYILSRSKVWRAGVKLRVFVVLTEADENPVQVEYAVVDFLQQMRINATVITVDLQNSSLQDDFRANHPSDKCPGGVPKLTVSEKFDLLDRDGDVDAASVGSSHASIVGSPSPQKRSNGFWHTSCGPFLPESDSIQSVGGNSIENDLIERAASVKSQQRRRRRYLAMDTAKKFNFLIQRNSPSASLVVTHLPLLHKASETVDFMEYVDTMTNQINNVLMILGTGAEYLTTVA